MGTPGAVNKGQEERSVRVYYNTQWAHLVLLTKDRKTEVSGCNAMDTPVTMQWAHLVLLTEDRKTEVSGYNAMDTPGAVNKGQEDKSVRV